MFARVVVEEEQQQQQGQEGKGVDLVEPRGDGGGLRWRER